MKVLKRSSAYSFLYPVSRIRASRGRRSVGAANADNFERAWFVKNGTRWRSGRGRQFGVVVDSSLFPVPLACEEAALYWDITPLKDCTSAICRAGFSGGCGLGLGCLEILVLPLRFGLSLDFGLGSPNLFFAISSAKSRLENAGFEAENACLSSFGSPKTTGGWNSAGAGEFEAP